MQGDMHAGAAIPSLRRFNEALLSLTEDNWKERLRPVLAELCFNLESFNPAFAAVLLRVQMTIGNSDYQRRDAALKQLIVPLAGEYGMHNGAPQGMFMFLSLSTVSAPTVGPLQTLDQHLRPQQVTLPDPTNMLKRPNILCCFGTLNGHDCTSVTRVVPSSL